MHEAPKCLPEQQVTPEGPLAPPPGGPASASKSGAGGSCAARRTASLPCRPISPSAWRAASHACARSRAPAFGGGVRRARPARRGSAGARAFQWARALHMRAARNGARCRDEPTRTASSACVCLCTCANLFRKLRWHHNNTTNVAARADILFRISALGLTIRCTISHMRGCMSTHARA